MKSSSIRTLTFVLTALAVLLVPGMAMAVGTTAGDVVTNSATLDFTVSTIAQTQKTAAADFTVDRKVNFTVAAVIGATGVIPGLVNGVLSFDVSNQANDPLGFVLDVVSDAGNTINMTGVQIWVEDGTTAGFQDTEDTLYTVGNFAFDIAENGADQRVYIVADTPGTASNGQIDNYYLVARASEPTTNTIITDTGGANGEDTEETVLADGSSAPDLITGGGADATYNNYYSDLGTFTVSSAIVTFTKTFDGVTGAVVWDPVFWNGGNRKAIPDAYIEYVITVANDGAATASAVLTTVTDTLPASVVQVNYMDTNLNTATPSSTIASNVVVTNCSTGGVRACDVTPQGFTSAVASLNMATLLPAEGTLAAGELAPGDSVEIRYMVQVQ